MPDVGELVGTITLEDRFTSALDRIADTVKEKAKEIDGLFGAVAVGATAAGAAVLGITGTILALGNAGSQLVAIENGFNRIAGSAENAEAIFSSMNKALHGALDDDFIRQFATKGITTGAMKTAEDFRVIGQAARSLAHDGFGSVEQMLGTISNALTTGRIRSLQYLTGVIDLKKAESEYAESLGTTANKLSAQGKLHADQIAIYDKLRERIATTGDVQTTFAEKISAANVALENWFEDIQMAVAKSPEVNRMLDAIGQAISDAFGEKFQSAGQALTRFIERFAGAVADHGPKVIGFMADVLDYGGRIIDGVNSTWNALPNWFKEDGVQALIAVGAVYQLRNAMLALAAAESGGLLVGFVGMLGKAINLLDVAGGAIMSMGTAMLGAEAAGGGLLGYFKNLGVALAQVGTIFLESPLGKATLWTAIAYGVYKVADAFWEMHKAAKETGSALNYFKQGGAFWDNSIIGRMLGMSKAKTDPLSVPDLPRIPRPVSNPFTPQDNAGETRGDNAIDAMIKKTADATKRGLEEQRKLWNDYYAQIDAANDKSLSSKLNAIDRWYEDEKTRLDEWSYSEKDAHGKSTLLNQNYYNDLSALDARFWQKRADETKKYWDAYWAMLPGQIPAPTSEPGYASAVRGVRQSEGTLPLDSKPLQLRTAATPDGNGLVSSLVQMGTAANEMDRLVTRAMEDAARAAVPLNESLKAGVRGLWDMGLTAEEIASKLNLPLNQVKNALGAMRPLLADLKNDIKGFADTMIQSLMNGGGVAGGLKAFGSQIGRDLGKAAGAGLGKIAEGMSGLLGKATGMLAAWLPGIGSMLGPLVEGVFNKLTHAEEKQVNKTREDFVQGFGKDWRGLANLNEKIFKATGSLDLVRNLLNAKSVEDYNKALKAVNETLQKATDLEQKQNQLAQLRLQMADKLLSNLNDIVAPLDTQVKAWDEIQKAIDEAKANGENYDALLLKQKGTITATKDELDALGSVALASFNGAIAQGKTFIEALDAAGPALNTIYKAFTDLGIPIDNAALKILAFEGTMLANNPALMHAVDALGSSFTILSNLGQLNVGTFTDMEHVIATMFSKLQGEAAKGGGSITDIQRNALIPMQDALHAAEQAAKDLGVPLDDNTQMLIDQSKELGIWKEKGKSATDIMIDQFKELMKSIKDLVDQLRGIPPVTNARVVVTYDENGNPIENPGDTPSVPGPGGWRDDPNYQPPAQPEAFGGVGTATKPMAFRTGGNGEQYAFSGEHTTFREVIQDALARAGGAGASVNIVNNFDMNGVLNEGDFAKLVEELAIPVIVKQIQNNTGGFKTTLKEDLGVA